MIGIRFTGVSSPRFIAPAPNLTFKGPSIELDQASVKLDPKRQKPPYKPSVKDKLKNWMHRTNSFLLFNKRSNTSTSPVQLPDPSRQDAFFMKSCSMPVAGEVLPVAQETSTSPVSI